MSEIFDIVDVKNAILYAYKKHLSFTVPYLMEITYLDFLTSNEIVNSLIVHNIITSEGLFLVNEEELNNFDYGLIFDNLI